MEFGVGIGAMTYTGDLAVGFRPEYLNPAMSAHFRLNLSTIVSTRFMLTIGQVSGDDENFKDALGENRTQSFNSTLLEGAAVMEYHFLDYKPQDSPIKWSPYLFGGFGMIQVNNPPDNVDEDFSQLQPVIPIGVGIKHKIGKRFVVEWELGARKTFYDYLDGISDGDVTNKNFQFGNPNDDDWYFFTGIRISFVNYQIPCPFPYVPNRSIFSR